MSTEKTVTLKSSDGEVFEIAEAVALQSQTIKHMIEDDCTDSGIPLPHLTGKILSKVIDYCKNHVEAQKTSDEKTAEDDLKSWDSEFVKVDQATLFGLILAANYLNIKSLLDLTCQTVVDMLKGVMSMVTLRSSDGEVFVIDVAVALQSQRIKHMIEDVPLPNTTEKILLKVIEYSWNHVDAQNTSNEKITKDDLKSLDAEFVKVIQDTILDIPLPNVTGKILSKVIEYCSYHVDAQKKCNEKTTKDDLKSWDAEFVKVDQHTLFDLILAANYLNIKSLLDLTCQTVADMLKARTPEEIRKVFNISSFTPEEEEEVRRENQWAFE